MRGALARAPIAQDQLGGRKDLRPYVPDMGFDIRVAVSASDRNTVVAVLDEVQLSDAIDVDRRHRLAALARRGDRLPSALESVRARSK